MTYPCHVGLLRASTRHKTVLQSTRGSPSAALGMCELLLRAFCCPLGAPSSWMSFRPCLQPVDFGQTTHIVCIVEASSPRIPLSRGREGAEKTSPLCHFLPDALCTLMSMNLAPPRVTREAVFFACGSWIRGHQPLHPSCLHC